MLRSLREKKAFRARNGKADKSCDRGVLLFAELAEYDELGVENYDVTIGTTFFYPVYALSLSSI